MMTRLMRTFMPAVLCLFQVYALSAQTSSYASPDSRMLGMEQVIELARENSIASMRYRNTFAVGYWNFMSYKAGLRPSLTLASDLANFNRSLVSLQDYNTGQIAYKENYTLLNSASISIRQNIALTGGTLSLTGSLSRLDQYHPSRSSTFYSQPFGISYSQRLSAYNSFKWDKKSEPLQYEISKKQFVENMEQVGRSAVSMFWECVRCKDNLRKAREAFAESRRLYDNACTRFQMGTVTKDNLLQLELKLINDSISISTMEFSYRSAQNRLYSYIGYKDDAPIEFVADYAIPEIVLDYGQVLEKALVNSSFSESQRASEISAERSVAQARSNRGVSATLNANLGMSGSAETVADMRGNMLNQQVVGVSLSMPLVDWGMGRGRLEMAKAQAETVRLELEQSLADFQEDVFVQVMQFNNQSHQCRLSMQAVRVAEQSYDNALKNFQSGQISVTELNQLQRSRDDAYGTYMSNVSSFWNQYYAIRGLTLYDFLTNTDIKADFDEIIKLNFHSCESYLFKDR